MVQVSLDSRLISPPDGFLIRKAPGNCFFDFAQDLMFAQSDRATTKSVPEKESNKIR